MAMAQLRPQLHGSYAHVGTPIAEKGAEPTILAPHKLLHLVTDADPLRTRIWLESTWQDIRV